MNDRLETPAISVVIPTYRRPQMLGRCLAGVCAQDFSPERFEVVVCDDGADAATRHAVEAIAAHEARRGLSVRYIAVTETRGPAGARNRGWQAARGDIVAFTDDDTIPSAKWLDAGWRAMHSGEARPSAASGRIVMPLPEHPTDYERDAAGLAGAEFATANCFVRRDVLERIGGFDERFTSAWREDSDLHFSILAAGGTIARAEDAIVVHPVRPAPWGCSIRQQAKSQFDALLYKKHAALYAARIARGPPWRYYVIVGSLCAAGTAIASGAAAFAAAPLALWGALTGSFALSRLRDTARTPLHVAEMVVTSIAIPPIAVFWRLYGAIKFRVAFL